MKNLPEVQNLREVAYLALTMSARITLAAAFLIHIRGLAALRAEIANLQRGRLRQRVSSYFGMLPVGTMTIAVAELGRIDPREIFRQSLRNPIGQ